MGYNPWSCKELDMTGATTTFTFAKPFMGMEDTVLELPSLVWPHPLPLWVSGLKLGFPV